MSGDLAPLIERWVRKEIRDISPYQVPDASGYLKLDAMENPYGWPASMVAEWQQLIAQAKINRYPDPTASELQPLLRQALDIPASMGMLLGNGSDEIIQILAMTLGGPQRVIVAPEPGFVMYRMIATFTSMAYHGVPLRGDFSLDREAMLKAIERYDPALIFLAYPNNPTGNLFARDDIEAIIEASRGVVVVDEAYHAFAQQSLMGELGRYPNLLVMRTLSKLGLAGLRLGAIAGPVEWIEQLDKVRLPYNINVLTQLTSGFALRHSDTLGAQCERIRGQRDRLYSALEQIDGLTPYPSEANFILFRTQPGGATALFERLCQGGVLIKHMRATSGPLADCLRVTVGTAQENQQFLEVVQRHCQ